jgi:hypothetical protein
MNWLGHFEFGMNQKSFFLNDVTAFDLMGDYAKTNINFWLLNWINYYRYVNEHHPANAIFFNYDKFCQNPAPELSGLFKKLNVISPAIQLKPFKPPFKVINGFDKRILQECGSIYKQLENKSALFCG